jgi:penicillin-binding protein 1A
MKRIFKILIIGVILVPFMVMLGFFIYLNNIDANMIDFSFSKTKHILIKDVNKKLIKPIKVRKYSETPLSSIPIEIQKIYLGINDNRFYEKNQSLKYVIREMVFNAGIDIENFCGKRYKGCYNPDIITKIAHNALVFKRRKIPLLSEEAYLAVKINQKYSKEALLERYFNQIYFGNGIFGIEAAARYYFGKSLSGLQLHQSVLLSTISIDYYVGEMDSSSRRFLEPEILVKRRNKSLDRLAIIGAISTKQAEEAKRKPLDLGVNLNG